jgi:hypothetical protein
LLQPKKVNKKTSPALWAPSPKGEGAAELMFIAAVDKKLKIICVSLNPSKLTPSSLKQGRLLTLHFDNFIHAFFPRRKERSA